MTQSALLTEKDFLQESTNVERKKHLQKIKILQSLYFKGSRTNTEVCEDFGISSPTAIRLLNQLIKDGWIEKAGRGESAGGRKPELYAIRRNSFYVMGVQLERYRIRMAIFDNHNQKLAEFEDLEFQIEKEASVVDYLYSRANSLIKNTDIEENKMLGIGISMPGLVSSEEGKNFTYFLKDEESESLEQALNRKFFKPVFILNDAKSAGFAEFTFGLARKKKNVLVIPMDWGLGLGILVDGKMHQGHSGFAGEFGHIPLIEDGMLCNCGKRGCLETVASGRALSRMAKEGIRSGEKTILSQIFDKDTERLKPEVIIDAANKGDQFAIKIISRVGNDLGKGIAILIQLFNPELIIIEGKFAEAGQFLTIPIQQSINTYCMPQLREKTRISLSTLGQDSVLLGSIATVMNNIFEDQIAFANDRSSSQLSA